MHPDGISDSDAAMLMRTSRQTIFRLRSSMPDVWCTMPGMYTAQPDDDAVAFALAVLWREREAGRHWVNDDVS